MVFSSMIFLWIFFPVVLIGYWILQKYSCKLPNIWLLCFSLLFYAWGEPKYIWLMIFSIVINYLSGIAIATYKQHKRAFLVLCLAANLLMLGYFKYFFTIETGVGHLLNKNWSFKEILLPIGISFYTFQSLSYVIDLYRGEIKLQKNIFNLALYVSFFPQLIAGPIVKYHDIAAQIEKREINLDKFSLGIERFIWGLGKKVIIANTVAKMADHIFTVPVETLNTAFLWLGVFLYTLQIYYDFSGYSDMAIGLGKMFGFDFLENFNYPYISKSIREFWRRWHISLSTWFKEYVYIPLGGNRGGG